MNVHVPPPSLETAVFCCLLGFNSQVRHHVTEQSLSSRNQLYQRTDSTLYGWVHSFHDSPSCLRVTGSCQTNVHVVTVDTKAQNASDTREFAERIFGWQAITSPGALLHHSETVKTNTKQESMSLLHPEINTANWVWAVLKICPFNVSTARISPSHTFTTLLEDLVRFKRSLVPLARTWFKKQYFVSWSLNIIPCLHTKLLN